MKQFVFGAKNNVEIIDLEKTVATLADTVAYVKEFAAVGKKILFVGSKNEARASIQEAAEKIEMPYVVNRWIGGTLTNFSEIKKRIALYKELTEKREKGSLTMYTKKERLLIDRDIESLETNFGGLITLAKMPDALFVIDPKKEEIAVSEAKALNIPVIAVANLDCDSTGLARTIPANDGSRATVAYIVAAIADAFSESYVAPKPKEVVKK
jgi:small subunit ribosomal protein S2